jgi:hypothetical protein
MSTENLVKQVPVTASARWQALWGRVAPKPTLLELRNTHLIGPFDNADHIGLDTAYGPERAMDLTVTYEGKDGALLSWRRTPELDGAATDPLDVETWTGGENWSVFYLYAEIEVVAQQLAHLAVKLPNMAFAWVNGQPVLAPAMPRLADRESEDVVVALKPDTNRLLVKLLFSRPQWEVTCRVASYGEPSSVLQVLEEIIGDATVSGETMRLVARYKLIEAYAALDDTDRVEEALRALEQDALANPWDIAWAKAVREQRVASGSYLPLHDVARRYEPLLNVAAYESFWPQAPPPAEDLAVLDVSDLSPQLEFALTVLQGLVNREQPRLYLLHTRYARQDRQWLDELAFEGYRFHEITVDEVWDLFRDVIQGAVLYDGAIMDEIGAYHSDQLNQTNVIMMVGALENAIPLTPEMNVELGLPVVFDARNKWADQYEMMHWAYVTLFPRMNRRILATNYPGIFLITDYLVQFRIFTFWFPEARTLPEENLLCGILASTPPNTPIVGWWFDWMPDPKDPEHREADAVMEAAGLVHGSYFGKVLTPSHEATNLSVHSGVSVGPWRHKDAPVPDFDADKVYYTHIISDGDNLGEALMMRTRDLQWDKPERGSFPMGWSFAPGAARMAPPVLNYYLRTATPNDLLVGGLGIGYTYPDVYLRAYPEHYEALYQAYVELTNEAMKWIDTTCLWLIDGAAAQEDRYARGSDGQLQAIFNGYGGGPDVGSSRVGPNQVAIFRSVTSSMWTTPRDEIVDLMEAEIREATASLPRPAFVEAWVLNWAWSMEQLQEVQARLGSEYVALRPDVFAALAREHMETP